MKIQSRLQMNLILSIGLCGTILLVFLWAIAVLAQAQRQHDTASEIRMAIFDRAILRDEYLLFQEIRPKRQWLEKQQKSDQLLALGSGLFPERVENLLITKLQKDNAASKVIFSKIVENREASTSPNGGFSFSKDLENSLISQLLQNSFEMNFACLELEKISDEILFGTQKKVGFIVIFLSLIFLPILVWSSMTSKRLITEHLARLDQGTKMWGSGNLDYLIPIAGDDETWDLAQACNTMTNQMKGSLTSIQSLEREIVERKRAEQEVKNYREHLEDLVKLRTEELSQEIEVRKMAEGEVSQLNQELQNNVGLLETTNKELESFSYTVSHDLRAPLRHLIGFVELLNKKTPTAVDEKSRHYLEVISNSATHMSRLVDDLLSFSRMGRAEMMSKSVPLDQLVKEAIEVLKVEINGRLITWEIERLPVVKGDPAMLILVLINLISNALKFTQTRQQALITIGYQENETLMEFYVRDNGVGFDMKYVDKLFNLFQRLHRTTEFEGTGLGLAIVRRIVHRHGGQTRAEGMVGKGATIFFSLPKS